MKENKTSLKSSFIKGSFWDIAASVIGRAGSLFFTILLARILLPEKFGIYSLAMSVALILLTFADLGINQAGVVFISSYLKNKTKARAYFRQILKYKIILALAISILILFLAYPISNYLFNKSFLYTPLLLLSLYIFFVALSGFFEVFFFVFNKVSLLAIKEMIFQLVRIGFIFSLPFLVNEENYVLASIGVMIFANFIVLLFVFYNSRKFSKSLFLKSDYKINSSKVKKFIKYASISTVSSSFFSYIDIIMLGIFVSSIQIGNYKAATALVFGIASLLNLYNVYLPTFSKSNKENLAANLNKILKYLSIISIPATTGLLILGKPVINAIYGSEFNQANLFLLILAPLLFIESTSVLLSSLFIAVKKPKHISILTLVSTGINILLNYILIVYLLRYSESLATAGAAIATTFSRLIFLASLLILTKKALNISINLNSLIKPVVATVIMSGFLMAMLSIIKELNLSVSLILIVVSMLVYFIVLYLMKGFAFSEFYSFDKNNLSLFSRIKSLIKSITSKSPNSSIEK